MQTVDVVHDSPHPPERVRAFLAEHENLGPLLGARITRLRDGDVERNGTGSARRLRVGPLPAFVETVTGVDATGSTYAITSGMPLLRAHDGRVEAVPSGTGSRVRWTIHLESVVPGVDVLLRLALAQRVRAGLRKADRLL